MSHIIHNGRDPKCPCDKCIRARSAYANRNARHEYFYGGLVPVEMLFGVVHPSELGAIEKPLEVRVARDIEHILDLCGDLIKDFKGIEELPYTVDLTKYDDAYAFALKHCPHSNLPFIEFQFKPELYCQDCNKYVTREDVSRSRDFE